jgi:hypothetical protein
MRTHVEQSCGLDLSDAAAGTVASMRLYMCSHATIFVSVSCHNVSSYYYICALILMYVRPHTTIYVSSYVGHADFPDAAADL